MNSYVLKHLTQCLAYAKWFTLEVFAVITKSTSQSQINLVLNPRSYSVSSFEALSKAL